MLNLSGLHLRLRRWLSRRIETVCKESVSDIPIGIRIHKLTLSCQKVRGLNC